MTPKRFGKQRARAIFCPYLPKITNVPFPLFHVAAAALLREIGMKRRDRILGGFIEVERDGAEEEELGYGENDQAPRCEREERELKN